MLVIQVVGFFHFKGLSVSTWYDLSDWTFR